MKRVGMGLFIVFAVCVFFPVHNAGASSVQDQLKATIDQVMNILRDPSLKGDDQAEKRRASLRQVIHERFSFAKMSQLSLARHWKKRSEEEKKTFVELFGQLLEQTYISKVESYNDERVVYLKEFVKKKRAQVNTTVITGTLEIPIDYRLYQSPDGAWMVYDIIIEGVSLVGNYRSQFDQILQKDPYEKLVEELKKKVNS
jgi:phospholipid transport system substrate-binding protein